MPSFQRFCPKVHVCILKLVNLQVERKQVGSANNPQGEAAVLEILRDDVEQAETEASLASERYALVSLQEKEVRRQHEEVV